MTPGIDERPVFFPCGPLSLAGVLSFPARPNDFTVLIPWGAGAYPSSGRNRLRARLARALAEKGFYALRFDYRGVGESAGDYRKPDLAAPSTAEIVAACEWLSSQGLSRILIVGNCFGSWSSLIAAPMIQGLEGMALVNTPVLHDHKQAAAVGRSWRWWFTNAKRLTLKKLKSPERRASYRKMVAAKAKAVTGKSQGDQRFSSSVRHVLNRHIPVLFIYGNDDFRNDFESELKRGLRRDIDQAGSATRLIVVDERLEGCASLEAQDVLIREVIPWLDELLKNSAKVGGVDSRSTDE